MSKKYRSQASSARAADNFSGFGTFQTFPSPLSYIAEQPNLAGISEPNIVVAFKNLGKKDSTTKAKALEELQDYYSANSPIEEAVLQAWSETYPRTSIDNSRRVRQLAHTFQGLLTVSAGKRIVPFLPKLIAYWIAGIKDNDKIVSRTAQDALEQAFTSPEKRLAVWKIYKDTLLDYVEDSVTIQTKYTLSDERTTSPDDAEAKYVRVVGTAINILEILLQNGHGEDLLSDKTWQLAYHDDPYLRRAVYRLALVTENLNPDWSTISTCFLSKGLQCDQTGTSTQFIQALVYMTTHRPQLWTTDYTSKTSVAKRLYQFLRRGSQNGTSETWRQITSLLRMDPVVAVADPHALAESLKTGAASDRVNTRAAWEAYVEVCTEFAERAEEKQAYCEQHILPIVVQYITKRGNEWPSDGRISQRIVSPPRGFDIAKLFEEMIQSTIDLMKLSLPETSKDYAASQNAVIAQTERLFQSVDASHEPMTYSSDEMLIAAIELLRSRKGKPYGAAGVLEILVRRGGHALVHPALKSFLDNDVPSMLGSPSATRLVHIAVAVGNRSIAPTLFQHEESLCAYLSSTDALDQSLESEIPKRLDSIPICIAIMKNENLQELQHGVLLKIEAELASTETGNTGSNSLLLLQNMLSDISIAKTIANSEEQSRLISRLLILADAGYSQAHEMMKQLNMKPSGTGAQILQRQLDGEEPYLSTSTLISLAQEGSGEVILPSAEQWEKALSPHLSASRPLPLTITSQLQGAIYLSDSVVQPARSSSDVANISQIFRLVLYVTKLDLNGVTGKDALYTYLPVALQLVNDKLTVENANKIWNESTPEVIQDAIDALGDGNRCMLSWLEEQSFVSFWLPRLHTAYDYCTALAWTGIMTEYVDRQGPTRVLEEYQSDLVKLSSSENSIQSAALLAVTREHIPLTNYGKRLCNELVAGATDGKDKHIILLNILLQGQPIGIESIPNQRIVFLMIGLTKDLSVSRVKAERLKLLVAIIPVVAEIYGQYWEDMLSCLVETWASTTDLMVLNASIRLFARLRQLVVQDNNEDLRDAWNIARPDLQDGLVRQLSSLDSELAMDQPRSITADLLRRQLTGIELKFDVAIFKHLTSSVEAIRTIAYEILHRTIPPHQTQLSLDVVLDGQDVHLPQPLLDFIGLTETTRQYLLSWRLVFDHFSTATFRLKEVYTEDIKKSGRLGDLLDFICDELRIADRAVDASKFAVQDFEVESEHETTWLTINLYYNSLLYLPGLVKEWYVTQKNRVKIPLESWTQKYVSPSIIAASLSSVSDWAKAQEEADQLRVKPSPKASELVASISIDAENNPIALAVCLPSSYPLESPTVASRNRVGVSEKNWASWLRTFQIIIFSTGSIIEGLIAFRRNVQGALKGQTECAICYSIIGTDMETPNKKCGTCKNTFHGACLFRWFKSSNSSSCPLCRNNFNYA